MCHMRKAFRRGSWYQPHFLFEITDSVLDAVDIVSEIRALAFNIRNCPTQVVRHILAYASDLVVCVVACIIIGGFSSGSDGTSKGMSLCVGEGAAVSRTIPDGS